MAHSIAAERWDHSVILLASAFIRQKTSEHLATAAWSLRTIPRSRQRCGKFGSTAGASVMSAHAPASIRVSTRSRPPYSASNSGRWRLTTHVFHQYVIRLAERDALRADLQAAGIGSGIHYPVPVHQQPAYSGRLACGPSGLGVTERAAPQILSLPIYPQI